MRTIRAFVPLLSLSGVALGVAGSAAAETSSSSALCAGAAAMSTRPASMAAASTTQTVVRDVRIGHHAGCDRVVIEFAGSMPGYSVRYVPGVIQDGSGQRVSLAGTAFLQVVLRPTSTVTHAPQSSTSAGMPVLREVKGAGDFEGVTSYGVGLASRQPFLAYRLASPNRLVIDVAAPVGHAAAPATTTTTQVSTVPSGGVQTGGGSTAGLRQVGLLAAGGGLILAAGGAVTARRRVAHRA